MKKFIVKSDLISAISAEIESFSTNQPERYSFGVPMTDEFLVATKLGMQKALDIIHEYFFDVAYIYRTTLLNRLSVEKKEIKKKIMSEENPYYFSAVSHGFKIITKIVNDFDFLTEDDLNAKFPNRNSTIEKGFRI